MSVIKYESQDFGALAWAIIANNNHREAIKIDQDECSKDGSFKIERLQDEDIAPYTKARNKQLNSSRAIYNFLTSIRYNIISQAGRSFLDEQDSERLENLIQHFAISIIEMSDPDRAVYEGD